MIIYKIPQYILLAAYGMPPMSPQDIRDFLINFLGYTEIHTKGSHHKFQKPNHPNAEIAFLEKGEIKPDSGFKPMLQQINFSMPMFNHYWDNRKQWLKKAKINREQTLQEFFHSSKPKPKPHQLQQSEPFKDILNQSIHKLNKLDKSIPKLEQLINQFPFVKKYFQAISPHMSKNDAYEALYQYVLAIEPLKNQYIKLY